MSRAMTGLMLSRPFRPIVKRMFAANQVELPLPVVGAGPRGRRRPQGLTPAHRRRPPRAPPATAAAQSSVAASIRIPLRVPAGVPMPTFDEHDRGDARVAIDQQRCCRIRRSSRRAGQAARRSSTATRGSRGGLWRVEPDGGRLERRAVTERAVDHRLSEGDEVVERRVHRLRPG
jgi:hypothetical protein